MNSKHNREQAVRQAKTNLILDAALKVFSEKGYYEARLEDIASEAGFSKGSLYNYYNDKEEIFLSLAAREHEHLYNNIKEAIDYSLPVIENIQRMFRVILTLFGKHFAIILTFSNFRLMNLVNIENLFDKEKRNAADFKLGLGRLYDLMGELIREGKNRGEIKTGLDEWVCANFLSSLLKGVIFEWKMAGKKGDIEKEIENVTEFLRNGMRFET